MRKLLWCKGHGFDYHPGSHFLEALTSLLTDKGYSCYIIATCDNTRCLFSQIIYFIIINGDILFKNKTFNGFYLLRFSGDFPSSTVGMLCSPGLIQRIGPSLHFVGWMSRIEENSPQGIVWKINKVKIKIFKKFLKL